MRVRKALLFNVRPMPSNSRWCGRAASIAPGSIAVLARRTPKR